MLLDFIGIDPIRELLWAAVINGVGAVSIMAALTWLVSLERVMGRYVGSKRLRRWSWLATAVMAAAV